MSDLALAGLAPRTGAPGASSCQIADFTPLPLSFSAVAVKGYYRSEISQVAAKVGPDASRGSPVRAVGTVLAMLTPFRRVPLPAEPPSQVHRELVLLYDLRHPHIIEGRDCWVDAHCVYMVQEFAVFGAHQAEVPGNRRWWTSSPLAPRSASFTVPRRLIALCGGVAGALDAPGHRDGPRGTSLKLTHGQDVPAPGLMHPCLVTRSPQAI